MPQHNKTNNQSKAGARRPPLQKVKRSKVKSQSSKLKKKAPRDTPLQHLQRDVTVVEVNVVADDASGKVEDGVPLSLRRGRPVIAGLPAGRRAVAVCPSPSPVVGIPNG